MFVKMRTSVWCSGLLLHLACFVVGSPLEPFNTGQDIVLTPFLRHWEAASYEPHGDVHRKRVRRQAPSKQQPIRISFKAHNREFNLRLRPDPYSVFAENVEFHVNNGQLDYDIGKVYSGSLEDDELSKVHGVITSNGLFDGSIKTSLDEYYIEPLSRYGIIHPHVHSIIYKNSDVKNQYQDDNVHCASHLLHNKVKIGHLDSIFEVYRNHTRYRRWLLDEDSQTDGPKKNPELPLDLDVPYTRNIETPKTVRKKVDKSNLIILKKHDDSVVHTVTKPKTHVEDKTKSNVILTKDIVKKEPVGFTVVSPTGNASDPELSKRRTGIDVKKTTCLLYLQADHVFYERYGTEEACIEVMTRHVQKVNAIYRYTDFNQDGVSDNITFMIKRIKVHTTDALKDNNYRYPGNYGVEKYLELFSEEDYDAFCLAYMFTYRDFEMGTLGLAWTGDMKNAGGVCEKNGHYRGSMKSLNTGIVTLLNYGKHVPPAVSHVTLAHEIGHNFGSPHDPDMCAPGGEEGNFIMFARATSGDKKNNNKFSQCSLKSIDPVLNSKARSAKGCFTEPAAGICGNGVVEDGEECDCGWAADCTDACCRPQMIKPHYKPCTLTENSVCSPTQGPCCTPKCTLKFGEKCREDNGCRDASYCDGIRPHCPNSRHKPNRTQCDKEFVCYMGECTGSICLAYGLESCQCPPSRSEPKAACELCCRKNKGECISSFKWPEIPDMYAKPGTPCNEYNGYCDVFQRCRDVDPSGPLATLRKLFLSEEGIASFKQWLLDYWYAVVLILLAVILLLFASTHWMGKHRNSNKSTTTILHSPTTETVRLPPDHVHKAVRTKLPLKKKVALRTHSNNKNDKSHNKTKTTSTDTSPTHKKTNKPDDSRQKVTKEETAVVTSADGKVKKHIVLKAKNKKRKTKKEVIDYSELQKKSNNQVDNDALSKVHKWLLSSPEPTLIPKSKSTPVDLTARAHRINKTSPRKTQRSSKSSNNLTNDKPRLQVVFKPPFKFSVKICKKEKAQVTVDKPSRPEADRRKSEPGPTSSKTKVTASKSAGDIKTTATSNVKQNKSNSNTKQDNTNTNILTRSASDCKLNDITQNNHSNKILKKSNSVGPKKAIAESQQNLLSNEVYDNDRDVHIYENIRASLSDIRCINKMDARQRFSIPTCEATCKDEIPLKRPQAMKLKRQCSENEISRKSNRKMDLSLPLSAGTHPNNVDLEGFRWSVNNGRLNVEVTVPKSERKESLDFKKDSCDIKKSTRASTSEKEKSRSKLSRHSVIGVQGKRDQGSKEERPLTFGELKNTVPDVMSTVSNTDYIKQK